MSKAELCKKILNSELLSLENKIALVTGGAMGMWLYNGCKRNTKEIDCVS